MIDHPKLYMLLLGCKPAGRNTEQHDIFFGIANSLKELVPQIENFWPGAGKIHIDAWREVNFVDEYSIKVIERKPGPANTQDKLFFLNLGGYKENEFEEYHYKMISVSADKTRAINRAKETAFFRHTGFKGANAHIDDKYGVDVDDVYEIEDILSGDLKNQFRISIEHSAEADPGTDHLHLGYFKLNAL